MSRNPKRKSKRKKSQKKEEIYFSNNININEFSEQMIKDLSSLKIIKELLYENNLSTTKVESIEHNAFNLLVNQIELEKENSILEVGVIGSFSSGKSTFINSLFGNSICPMAVKPTTSSITKFYYGEKEKITVNGKEITQKDYDDLAQHLKGDTKNTQTNYIEYAYPFERLQSIVLYDTPGFNNSLNENDEVVTMKTLDSVDVIFFVVDISKGAIDQSSIERLRELKEKRIYCILNKSDLKSEQAIAKIKHEIVSEKIFLEVIEYSASKVLELGGTNCFTEYIQHVEENLIARKIDFTSNIKGVIKETKSRLKTKNEYQLCIDNDTFIVDDFYVSAKNQKIRIAKMLNMVAGSKQSTFQQKLKIDRHNYHEESKTIIEEELNIINNSSRKDKFKEFENAIEQFKNELYSFEKEHIKNFYNEWNYSFKNSCNVKDVSKEVKSYWSTPYSKIFFNKETFKSKIIKIDSLKYMKEFINKWVVLFKENYNVNLTMIDFDAVIYNEALDCYSNLYNYNSHIKNYDDSMYFEDKLEAKKHLESFLNVEHKEHIDAIRFFLATNQETIEEAKRVFHTQNSEKTKSIKKLKEEINNFIKEKEAYAKKLQR